MQEYFCKLIISGAGSGINNLISDSEPDFGYLKKPEPDPDQLRFFSSKSGPV